jgi:hypothetical protein
MPRYLRRWLFCVLTFILVAFGYWSALYFYEQANEHGRYQDPKPENRILRTVKGMVGAAGQAIDRRSRKGTPY